LAVLLDNSAWTIARSTWSIASLNLFRFLAVRFAFAFGFGFDFGLNRLVDLRRRKGRRGALADVILVEAEIV
jgi:hypothetical protein